MNIYDIKVKNRAGVEVNLNKYRGGYLIIVNTASKCGYTPQFEGLEKIYKKYKNKNVGVIGFPCGQFRQEYKTSKKANEFCKMNYGVTFPIMSMIDVNGKNESPIYSELKKQKRNKLKQKRIVWNFTKFLIDPNGCVIKRYGSSTDPEVIDKDLKKILEEKW